MGRRGAWWWCAIVWVAGCTPGLPDVAEPCALWEEPGLFKVRVKRQGDPNRVAWVYVPKSAGPRDLVVVMHGAGKTGQGMMTTTEHDLLADEEGFVAIYPDGTGLFRQTWNAGNCCGSAQDKDIDDVGFLDQLIDEVSPMVCGGRVLGVGGSNGGMMAHRWGCEGRTPDAIQPNSSGLYTDGQRCEGPPLPVFHIHGLADQKVPVAGGQLPDEDYVVPSVEDTIGVWRARNECTDDPPEITVDGEASCSEWQCEASTRFCGIAGWGHGFPGGNKSHLVPVDATVDGWLWFQSLWEPTAPSGQGSGRASHGL